MKALSHTKRVNNFTVFPRCKEMNESSVNSRHSCISVVYDVFYQDYSRKAS